MPDVDLRQLEALAAAEPTPENRAALLGCPCEEHETAWAAAHRTAAAVGAGWCPQPQGGDVGGIRWCARVAGEQPVREAIQRELVAWALA